MSRKTDQELLAVYDALPGLLELAHEQAKDNRRNVYEVQDQLAEEYRAAGQPFRRSMPYRSFFTCSQCAYMTTEIEHTLENPRMQAVDPALARARLHESDVHQIRAHVAPFAADCRRFLEQL